MYKRTIFVILTISLCLAAFIAADWDPADGHKMHFPQFPDETGFLVRDVPMYAPLGDDWECSETGWVKEIHFWGAWHNDEPGTLLGFHIRIGTPGNFQDMEITNFSTRSIFGAPRGYLIPTGTIISDIGLTYYQYNIELPDSLWYWQDAGNVYWLYIAPILGNETDQWGWYTSLDYYGANAVYWDPVWMEYRDIIAPEGPSSHDLAFVINGDPEDAEACCLPEGVCTNLGPTVCLDLNGTPGGPGSLCTGERVACCMPDGSCQQMDWYCCATGGGQPSPLGYEQCLGDNDGSGVDDACEVCYAAGDVNGDGVTLTVADLVHLIRYLNYDTTATGPLYEGDLNGDCRLDYLDVFVYQLFFDIGLPAFAPWGGYPVATCCNPDTLRGATCVGDSCLILHPLNVAGVGGIYNGDNTACYPDNPCDTCLGQYPGDVNNDGMINIGDVTYMIDWLFKSGSAPPILPNGDPDGNCCADTNDILYIAAFLTQGGPAPVECTCWDIQFCPDTCENQNPGDVNGDGSLDISDVNYLVAYIRLGGPAPVVAANGDFNGDWCVDMWDVVDLQAYLFTGGAPPVACTCVDPPKCECFIGDANNDAAVNVGDAVYLISYVFKDGPAPVPYDYCSGDANCDCEVNVGDAVYIISYVFRGGPRPCSCCAWVNSCGAIH